MEGQGRGGNGDEAGQTGVRGQGRGRRQEIVRQGRVGDGWRMVGGGEGTGEEGTSEKKAQGGDDVGATAACLSLSELGRFDVLQRQGRDGEEPRLRQEPRKGGKSQRRPFCSAAVEHAGTERMPLPLSTINQGTVVVKRDRQLLQSRLLFPLCL